MLFIEYACCSLRREARSKAAAAQTEDYVLVEPSDMVLYDVNREGEAVIRAKDMMRWAVKKGVSNALKGASLLVFSVAAITGISAVIADRTAAAVTDILQSSPISPNQLVPPSNPTLSLISPPVYRALHAPLRCMHHMSMGFLVAADSVDLGETDQLTDLARISYTTRGSPSAYLEALEATVAERRAAGMASDRLESCLLSYRNRLANSDTFFHRTIPGLAEGD